MENINSSMIFASKNVKNSIFWSNENNYFNNKILPLNFVEFINDEMIDNTCQSSNHFKNTDVMYMDNVIGDAYVSLINIYKKNFTIKRGLIEAMQYFTYNCTLVSMTTLSQIRKCYLILPAYPRLLAEKCDNTVKFKGEIYKQWNQSDLDNNGDNEKFNKLMENFTDEMFREIITLLFAKFPLSYNTISVQKVWKEYKLGGPDSRKIKCSLLLSWLAMHEIFYEPRLVDMGYPVEVVDNNVFKDIKSNPLENFKLEIEVN